ncbi:DUF1254 domain-containing protein [Paraburkholderia bonniea]|uniref:DUF1254 domain-containing protein n=1 Tax=Paraburkholderia bonniea TaxID=2152891 RepID=UPI001292877B|nr:DUF1254 domain-containing protein [Paraburkholderia bonniea]WJF90514.1 DUF1254 domain-containing protein [Paraburkholderia bonniea]WJF93829.1 DUF1254 domain-containing protein [Paraburkholderia bonniea]
MNKTTAAWATTALLASLASPMLAQADSRAPATVTSTPAAAVPGPVAGDIITEDYARLVARSTYFWAWPIVNLYNRLLAMQKVPVPGLNGGTVPVGPPNRLSMLHDYIDAQERFVACPNQDVVYGSAILDLDQSPVVVQVPDFGSRFWVYQAVDGRTDGFIQLGKMYGTKPGFYLLVGPTWKGQTPPGIKAVFRSSTRVGTLLPRVFMDDTAEDRKAIQSVINQVNAYPLAEFDGRMKTTDWSKLPSFPTSDAGAAEIKWVDPQTFFDELPAVLDATPPQAGEQALYTQARALLAAAKRDPALKAAITDEAQKTEAGLINPLFNFSTYGQSLPANWTTITNGARFGTDYFTRTAVARSNIFVNQPQETKYFYLDADAARQKLNGSHAYTVTFAKGQLPPVKGFWSLTLYNQHHFFAPNELKRYSLGTKNKDLKYNADGSLTLYVQSTAPAADKRSNWLPAPAGEAFSLYIRAYWPQAATLDGSWTPPPVNQVQ